MVSPTNILLIRVKIRRVIYFSPGTADQKPAGELPVETELGIITEL